MATLESTLVSKRVNVQAPLPVHKLLSICPKTDDHDTLRCIVTDHDWRISSAGTLYDALQKLISERFAVVFCEERLEDGSWTDLLHHPSQSPVVVTSRLADARLWGEVLNLGGYDVLAKPFNSREVLHLLRNITLGTSVEAPRVRVAGAM